MENSDPTGVMDEQTLDHLQRDAFGYFVQAVNPVNGLVADTTRENSPCSIAVVGFALSVYPVAVERGWMERGPTQSDAASPRCVSFATAIRAAARMQPATRASITTSSTWTRALASGARSCR